MSIAEDWGIDPNRKFTCPKGHEWGPIGPGCPLCAWDEAVERQAKINKEREDRLDMENTLAAIADPDDYEMPGREKTAELCRQLAAACMARLNL